VASSSVARLSAPMLTLGFASTGCPGFSLIGKLFFELKLLFDFQLIIKNRNYVVSFEFGFVVNRRISARVLAAQSGQ
jgi:hypothetical protein